MLIITCPICGIRADETEFTCGGEAHLDRPHMDAASPKALDALNHYLNPPADLRGWVRELWRCRHGCGGWFAMKRHTGTHRVGRAYALDSAAPPPFPEDAA